MISKHRGGGLDVLIFAGNYKNKNTLDLASSFKALKIIIPFSFSTLFKKAYCNVFYHQFHKHREVYKALKLVRAIDKRHFDKNIKNIDFQKAQIQSLQSHKNSINEFLKSKFFKKYKLIIAINAFGNTHYSFSASSFALLAQILASKYKEVLFVMMNYEKNPIAYKTFKEENIIIFNNDKDLLNLAEFTSRVHLLISCDTGNVHLADIFKVPILQTIKANLKLKWGGGSFNNECMMLILKDNWVKNYNTLFHSFTLKAQIMIEKLLRQRM